MVKKTYSLSVWCALFIYTVNIFFSRLSVNCLLRHTQTSHSCHMQPERIGEYASPTAVPAQKVHINSFAHSLALLLSLYLNWKLHKVYVIKSAMQLNTLLFVPLCVCVCVYARLCLFCVLGCADGREVCIWEWSRRFASQHLALATVFWCALCVCVLMLAPFLPLSSSWGRQ